MSHTWFDIGVLVILFLMLYQIASLATSLHNLTLHNMQFRPPGENEIVRVVMDHPVHGKLEYHGVQVGDNTVLVPFEEESPREDQ